MRYFTFLVTAGNQNKWQPRSKGVQEKHKLHLTAAGKYWEGCRGLPVHDTVIWVHLNYILKNKLILANGRTWRNPGRWHLGYIWVTQVMKKDLGNETMINLFFQVLLYNKNDNSYDSQAHVSTAPGRFQDFFNDGICTNSYTFCFNFFLSTWKLMVRPTLSGDKIKEIVCLF